MDNKIREYIDELLKQALEEGFSEAEVYYGADNSMSVSARDGKIIEFENSDSSGISFRGLYNGQMGSADTEDIQPDMIPFLINQAKGIITDSGNIAEEATFLDVPCITLNSYAEHPETWRIGTNELVGDNTFSLSAALDKLMHGEWKHTTLPDRWDGRTAERIVQTMLNVEKV